ncbi:hypothetical protein [Streptosporangium sp. 'caverna']|uniref:hypothetical protein n=1 Tax=Streptosporangium sp. 'caverna' TaxID=2202249 RepID=UPI0013A6A183|nr:hypothetical protein [Streptosporangium sp. 'caverna']
MADLQHFIVDLPDSLAEGPGTTTGLGGGPTTYMTGEEGGGGYTTYAIGEEGCG